MSGARDPDTYFCKCAEGYTWFTTGQDWKCVDKKEVKSSLPYGGAVNECDNSAGRVIVVDRF